MFNWFKKRKDVPPPMAVRPTSKPPAASAPSQLQAPEMEAANAELTVPDALHDLAMTVPAVLQEISKTMPASLETWQGMSADAPGESNQTGASALFWMLGAPEPVEGLSMPDAEVQLLRRFDTLLAAPQLPDNLLPRAPAVIPQLLGLLRREQPSRTEVARQVSKDMLLTAEVLRVARAAEYGGRPVARLEDALDRIGSFGLQSATLRVLMKPVFQAQAGGLTARAAPRIWLYAESKSMFCAELAASESQDRFEAFLAGLLHDGGWLALLRLLDRLTPTLRPSWSSALDAELAQRKDRLFGRLTADWGLTLAVTNLSQLLASGGPAVNADPLARLLRRADRLCLAHVSGATDAQRGA